MGVLPAPSTMGWDALGVLSDRNVHRGGWCSLLALSGLSFPGWAIRTTLLKADLGWGKGDGAFQPVHAGSAPPSAVMQPFVQKCRGHLCS